VVHNGVDLREIRRVAPETRDRPYVLAIGRHVPQKGFDVLIDAYAGILAANRDAPDLVIAGDGPERERLEKLAADRGLGDRIGFPGRCDRPRTAALFRGCELFVLPSRHEPQGIVCLEAMAAGKPVVATRVGGVPEIVTDGECGLLVEPAQAAPLRDAITSLLVDEERRAAMGAASSARAEQFDWSVIAAQYEDVYRSARGRRP
jgi:glycosyltransferase involved in cell wall biosynthesis